MILNRWVVRVAAVNALLNFNEEPYPTLARQHVFDSKIEPVQSLRNKHSYPICVVYTDYDKDALAHGSMQNKHRHLTVTFEIFCALVSEADDDVYQLEYPLIDAELETTLDIFEAQIFHALQAENLAADTFRALMHAYDSVVSRRGATVEGGQKLAARQIVIEGKCLRDPQNGEVPQNVEPFLTELETRGEYADRVAYIRAAYERTLTAAQQHAFGMGYSTATARNLGYDTGPEVRLPSNVTYVYP
ncbi:MAG: hypothetical protein JJ902_05440 [Roseibium sp.]|nr:hypothetical protein [Roseibium sp.]